MTCFGHSHSPLARSRSQSHSSQPFGPFSRSARKTSSRFPQWHCSSVREPSMRRKSLRGTRGHAAEVTIFGFVMLLCHVPHVRVEAASAVMRALQAVAIRVVERHIRVCFVAQVPRTAAVSCQGIHLCLSLFVVHFHETVRLAVSTRLSMTVASGHLAPINGDRILTRSYLGHHLRRRFGKVQPDSLH